MGRGTKMSEALGSEDLYSNPTSDAHCWVILGTSPLWVSVSCLWNEGLGLDGLWAFDVPTVLWLIQSLTADKCWERIWNLDSWLPRPVLYSLCQFKPTSSLNYWRHFLSPLPGRCPWACQYAIWSCSQSPKQKLTTLKLIQCIRELPEQSLLVSGQQIAYWSYICSLRNYMIFLWDSCMPEIITA